jgi:hypothetical protein
VWARSRVGRLYGWFGQLGCVVVGVAGLLYAANGGANRAENGRRSGGCNAAARVTAVLKRSLIANRLRMGNGCRPT